MSFESIQEMFCKTADRLPERAAIDRGGRVTTYREIEEESNRLASRLLAGDASPGDAAALLIEDPAKLVASLLGCLKARCLFVPFDAGTPERRLAGLLDDVRPRWILVESKHSGKLLRLGPAAAAASVIDVDNENDSHRDAGRVLVPPDPEDRSYVFFTSGSTGAPKGIVGRLQAIDHFVRWEIETFGLGEGTRVSQLTTPAFDAVLRDLFVPLCSGGTACAPEIRAILLDPRRLADWIEEAAIHVLHCVPSLFRSLLSQNLVPERFPALRHVLLAGEPLLPGDVERWTRVFGERIELVNLYGPSETTMTKLFYRVKPGDGKLSAIPIGKPMRGAAALVVDDRDRPCSPGQVGEILIRTPFRAHGYWNRPDLTDQAFVPNPFGKDPADRVYRTGDLARVLEDGSFVFLGRVDQQVKIRGVRIEPAEIEALLRRHEAVVEAVVTTSPRDGEAVLCAFLVLQRPVEPGTWRELLSAELPEAMIPSHFIVLEKLPRTLSGKIDRRALPAPEESRAGGTEAPSTPTEELVAGIFKDVLGVEQIGVHDNFFERGGHSLLAIQALARMQEAFAIDPPLTTLFERPTIAEMAAFLEEESHKTRDTMAPVQWRAVRGEAPLSFSQRRLWLIDQLEPGSAFYNILSAIRLNGRLKVNALRRALDEIVRRQESLRTVFPSRGDGPVQVILPAGQVELPVIDLRNLPTSEGLREARRAIAGEELTPFDLCRGPLLRCRLLQLQDDEHVLICSMHHIISDHQSVKIFRGEMAVLYEAFARGESASLPELEVQYADFAAWQQQWLQGAALESNLLYWKRRLAGAPARHGLATNRERTTLSSFAGEVERFMLPAGLSNQLRELSRSEECTLFMTLLAAFQVLLCYRSGQRDVVVGAPMTSRNWPGADKVIGFFIDALVLRTDLSGDPTFREILARVRQQTLKDYAHQNLPFDRLVEELKPERSGDHNPLFQVTFNFLDRMPEEEISVAGLAISPFELSSQTAQFDLSCVIVDTGKGLAGSLRFKTSLFDRDTISWLSEQLRIVLTWIGNTPDGRLSELLDALAETDERRSERISRELEQSNLYKLRAMQRRTLVSAEL
ncbi:MAG TPA: amino acid adenylation domain-containing protein [Thermoanaerobaculia bacterium]|nr:amino acid adenylation domain-containing protein [Thermoanaerobaculia bacterium]